MDVGTGLAVYGVGKIAQYAVPAIMRLLGPGLTIKEADAQYYADCKKTEAKADRIIRIAAAEALGAEHALEIAHRARMRADVCDVEQQRNLESIGKKAAELTFNHQVPDPQRQVDLDWISQFRESCKHTSDEEMQSLWARILAGEIEHPGKFSLRTVGIVRTLRKSEAELFRRLCAAVVFAKLENSFYVPVLNNITDKLVFSETLPPISYDELLDLESYGLVHNAHGKLVYNLDNGEFLTQGKQGILILSSQRNQMHAVGLTPVGKELCPLAMPDFDSSFMDRCAKDIFSRGGECQLGEWDGQEFKPQGEPMRRN